MNEAILHTMQVPPSLIGKFSYIPQIQRKHKTIDDLKPLYPKILDEIHNIGNYIDVIFLDNGEFIPYEEAMRREYNNPNDGVEFIVANNEGKKFRLYRKKSHQEIIDLKEFKRENNNTLIGLKIRIIRLEINNPHAQNYKFELLESQSELEQYCR